jgi:hypothetical protein
LALVVRALVRRRVVPLAFLLNLRDLVNGIVNRSLCSLVRGTPSVAGPARAEL